MALKAEVPRLVMVWSQKGSEATAPGVNALVQVEPSAAACPRKDAVKTRERARRTKEAPIVAETMLVRLERAR